MSAGRLSCIVTLLDFLSQMKFDLRQSWIEALSDKSRLQWEVLSVSYSLALFCELVLGTDVSLGFEPLPNIKLSFKMWVHYRQHNSVHRSALIWLNSVFSPCFMGSECCLQLIITLRCSLALLNSCLILWLKTMKAFPYCAFQPISSGQ